MALGGTLVVSEQGLTSREGRGEEAMSPQHLPLQATVSIHPDRSHGHLGCDTHLCQWPRRHAQGRA